MSYGVPLTLTLNRIAGIDGQVAYLMLRWSDDGGHTWSNQHVLSVGSVGQYAFRCFLNRLGRSRDRVYEVSCSDPIPWRFIDAYLTARGEAAQFKPGERYAQQIRKIT